MTKKLTIEVTREQQTELARQFPGLVKEPAVAVTPYVVHTATGYNDLCIEESEYPGGLISCGVGGGFTAALTPRMAREAARALIVAAGELEGRVPVPQSWLSADTYENSVLGDIDRMLAAEDKHGS